MNLTLSARFCCPYTGIWDALLKISLNSLSHICQPHVMPEITNSISDDTKVCTSELSHLTPCFHYLMCISQAVLKRVLHILLLYIKKKKKETRNKLWLCMMVKQLLSPYYTNINPYNFSYFSWLFRIFLSATTWFAPKKGLLGSCAFQMKLHCNRYIWYFY